MKYRIAVNPRLVPKGTGTLARAIAQCGLPDACEIIHSGRNVVARMANEGLVLKAYKVPGLIKGLIYRWFRQPKSRRAYANAQRLLEMGINTPEPAFAIECYNRTTGLCKSYYACTDLDGWNDIRGIQNQPDFDAIARELAQFIFNLHVKGINMKDMSPGNILYRHKNDNSYEFALIDINRMEFDVDAWLPLIDNFKALLDTEEATAKVAFKYREILETHNIHLAIDNFEDYVSHLYTNYYKRKTRWRRIKKLFK